MVVTGQHAAFDLVTFFFLLLFWMASYPAEELDSAMDTLGPSGAGMPERMGLSERVFIGNEPWSMACPCLEVSVPEITSTSVRV